MWDDYRNNFQKFVLLTQAFMKEKLTPIEKEIHRLHQAGKAPDRIAIRIGMKMSKVMTILNMPFVKKD